MGSVVSVVLPVYNGELYLSQALDSLLAQTYRPLEVIAVDDGSTDSTAAILRAYADRVITIRQPNQGTAAARNAGIARATGPYLSFMDADDILHPEKIERQVACLEVHPEAHLCNSYVQNFWMSDIAHEKERLRDWSMATPQPGFLLQAIVVRRPAFDRVGLFDDRFRVANDTEWFIRVGEMGLVTATVQEVLLYRRIHRTNITRLQARTVKDDMTEMVKRALDRRRAKVST